jgi:hypothetical protein
MDGKVGGNRNQTQNINQSFCCDNIFSGIVIILLVHFNLYYFCGPDCLSLFPDGLFMVWAYIQAGQSYLQQIPSLYLVDSHNVCLFFLDISFFRPWAIQDLFFWWLIFHLFNRVYICLRNITQSFRSYSLTLFA